MSTTRGEYRSLYVTLWNSPDFQALTPQARLVWLAIKGNAGPCGIAVIPGLNHALAEWTGLDVAAVSHARAQLEHMTRPWVRAQGNVVWVLDGITHEPSRNPRDAKHRHATLAHLASLPKLEIVRDFCLAHPEWVVPDEARAAGMGWVYEGPSKALRSPFEDPSKALRSTETETETETETKGVAHAPPAAPVRDTPPGPHPVRRTRKADPAPWMGEIRATWRATYGGDPPAGAATVLRPLEREHGIAVVVAHLARYCAETAAAYASLPRFAQTFGAWAPQAAPDPASLPDFAGGDIGDFEAWEARQRGGRAA